MIKLICDHCGTPAEYLYGVGHTSIHNGHVYENSMSETDLHLHWECIPLWWAKTEEERNSDVEVPF